MLPQMLEMPLQIAWKSDWQRFPFLKQTHLIDWEDTGAESSKNVANKFKQSIETGLSCNCYTGYCLENLLRIEACCTLYIHNAYTGSPERRPGGPRAWSWGQRRWRPGGSCILRPEFAGHWRWCRRWSSWRWWKTRRHWRLSQQHWKEKY